MISIQQQADDGVRALSDGQYYLQCDAGSLFLVKSATNERTKVCHTYTAANCDDVERLARVAELSERERQVFQLLGDSREMSEIATRMGISVKTAETYRARIKQKLDTRHRTHLLALAVQWRLTQ